MKLDLLRVQDMSSLLMRKKNSSHGCLLWLCPTRGRISFQSAEQTSEDSDLVDGALLLGTLRHCRIEGPVLQCLYPKSHREESLSRSSAPSILGQVCPSLGPWGPLQSYENKLVFAARRNANGNETDSDSFTL